MKKYGVIELPDDFEKKEDKCPLSIYIEDYVSTPYYECGYSKEGYCVEDKCPMKIVNMEVNNN